MGRQALIARSEQHGFSSAITAPHPHCTRAEEFFLRGLKSDYNSSFALMHEDYTKDAVPIEFGLKWLLLYVLSPVDLAVSKIARWAD